MSWLNERLGIASVLALAAVFLTESGQAEVIDCQEPGLLQRIKGTGGFYGAAMEIPYHQAGMTVIGEVKPRDRRLGGAYYFHIHLGWSDPSLLGAALRYFADHDGQDAPFALALDRRCLPHSGDGVIQMTYDPNNDSRLDRFNLISIDVINGPLNVGVRFADGSIGVYNNLSSGFRWFLIGANGLTRATLEGIGTIFAVDNIVFSPTSRSSPAASATSRQAVVGSSLESGRNSSIRSEPISGEADPLMHDALEALFERKVAISVLPRTCLNQLPPSGQLPVAVLGSSALDVAQIDRRSVRLHGVLPEASEITKLAVTPGLASDGACAPLASDSFSDLRLVFDARKVREALGPDAAGLLRQIELTGALVSGARIHGSDAVLVPE